MTDATSLNLSPSPLAALTSAGAAGVVAQGVGVVTQGTGEDPAGGFQAMLTAQAGGAYDPAPSAQPVVATNLGQTAPLNAPLTNAALPNATLPAQDANLAATPAPTATTMAAISAKSALPIMAGASLNGNLPLGGKILPVAEEDAAASPEAAAMAMPSPAMEGAKSLAAKSISPAARPRKNAGAELQQDDPQAALDKTSADKGEDAVDAAAVPAAASDTLAPEMMAMATPQPAVTPREPEARKPAPSDAAPSDPAFSGPVSSGPVSSGNASSANASLRPAAALAGEAAQLSLQPVATQSTAPANQVAGTGADKSNAPAAIMQPGILPWPGQPQVPAESAPAQAAQPAPMRMADAAVPLSPKVLGPKAGAAKADKASAAAAATLPDATLSATANSPALASATPQDASPLLRDALAPLASSSLPDGSAAGNALDRSSIAAPAEGAASRDMGALVDRLVEARAAMRSGSSTQWVQTSVQHAEFGRVALQIRQDGDQLSVAMASQDPGFAPAAQAALHASQSLLQPAPASQGSADTPPDQRSPDQRSQDQRSGQQAQGNGNTPFGQPSSGGQPGGQDRQSPFRQQAPALADNQRAPQPAPTMARNAAAPSGRSGILA